MSAPTSASILHDFFVAVDAACADSDTSMSQFFVSFEKAFHASRSERALTTPHLNVLKAFGLEFAELRHSAVLAWFLSPDSEHEQGVLFVNALLEWFQVSPLKNERYTVLRERHHRIDVAAYAAGDFAIFIENKVRHHEREKQVSDMIDSMLEVSQENGIPDDRRFAVFLTDTGAAPVTGPPKNPAGFLNSNLKSARRVELFERFRVALVARTRYSPLLLNFLDSYLGAIRRLRASL